VGGAVPELRGLVKRHGARTAVDGLPLAVARPQGRGAARGNPLTLNGTQP
jgi:hypothetical protein